MPGRLEIWMAEQAGSLLCPAAVFLMGLWWFLLKMFVSSVTLDA